MCLAEGNVRCKASHSSARKPTSGLLASLSHSPSRLKPGRMSSELSHPLRGFDQNQYIPPIEKGAIKAPISIGGGHGTRTRGAVMAEGTGLEPAGLLHLTRFPGELLSHSVNPPCQSLQNRYSICFLSKSITNISH